MTEEFKIKGEYIELIKLLKASGLCDTGGMAKLVVEDGLVYVDNHIEFRKHFKLRKGQVVMFQENRINIV
ncbi:S4-domain-containing protein [Desulfonema limicola]|uniref:S4-domain-containing protein n=1 Tax=Desulfonema limicola TaxID=45656 RepID=A0A975B9Q1_9BACT|nr:RNA-binding S4 domain-containing protein [Desulfonema limicola]QTA81574.1 S4-domain-containing protein [Desulfonema limicola]